MGYLPWESLLAIFKRLPPGDLPALFSTCRGFHAARFSIAWEGILATPQSRRAPVLMSWVRAAARSGKEYREALGLLAQASPGDFAAEDLRGALAAVARLPCNEKVGLRLLTLLGARGLPEAGAILGAVLASTYSRYTPRLIGALCERCGPNDVETEILERYWVIKDGPWYREGRQAVLRHFGAAALSWAPFSAALWTAFSGGGI